MSGLELRQLLLIAFASDESVPGRIRSGELYFVNRFFTQQGVLTLTDNFKNMPNGLISEMINSIDIHHVVLCDRNILDLFFAFDFNLSLHKLKAVTIKNIGDYFNDLSNTLYTNNTIQEIYLINVFEILLPVNVSQMDALRKLVVIDAPLNKLPVFNNNLEVLVLEKTDLNEVDFLNCSLQNLKELRITHGQLSEIKNINKLINLTYLDVSRQNILNLELNRLNKLEVLIARRNKLGKFPEIKMSTNTLRVLDLSFNLIQLTSDIVVFPKLEQFIFENNYFSILDELFSPFQNVYRLDLSANDIIKIGPILSHFKRLSVLNLENNNLESVEEIIKSIPSDGLEIRLRGNNLSNQEKIKLTNLESKTVSL
jgi:Leucine-rich repeat (LRR) protein